MFSEEVFQHLISYISLMEIPKSITCAESGPAERRMRKATFLKTVTDTYGTVNYRLLERLVIYHYLCQ